MFLLTVRLALINLIQRPFSRILVISSMACILMIAAMIFIFMQGVSRTLLDVRSSYLMTAFLNASVSVHREQEILSAVKKISGVDSAQLVNRDSFVTNIRKMFPKLSSEAASLETESIPRYIKIKAGEMLKTQSSLQKILGVEFVEVSKNKFTSLVQVLENLKRLALVLICGVFASLFCVLINHFKLGTTLAHQTHHVLKLLGARRFYFSLLFVFEGAAEGALAGILSVIGMLIISATFESTLAGLFLSMGYSTVSVHFSVLMALGLVTIGIVAGSLVSLWTTFRKVY